MFETADDVLEHFGVRGMRWGVRNQRSSGEGNSSKKKRAVKIAVGAGVVIAGAAFATLMIRKHGSTSIKTLASRDNAARVGAGFMAASKIASRPRITKSASADIAKMRAEIAASIKAANSQLKETDNRLNIPIYQREYINEWG